ncbi:MAG: ATP-binding cassette domain-containing protein [Gammaproteobacteria bacterium]
MSAASIVELRALHYAAGGRRILDIPEWCLAVGEHCLVLGPSGSGKTTLLHLLAGLIKPTQGHVMIAGQALDELKAGALDAFRGRHIGVVFQTLHLNAALNVADNLRLARYLAGLPQDDARMHQTLAALGIADKAARRIQRLSHGEAQRVAIARAVLNQPGLILADEPTSALDDASCAQVLDLLLGQADNCGATLLVATHDSRVKARFPRRMELEH